MLVADVVLVDNLAMVLDISEQKCLEG